MMLLTTAATAESGAAIAETSAGLLSERRGSGPFCAAALVRRRPGIRPARRRLGLGRARGEAIPTAGAIGYVRLG